MIPGPLTPGRTAVQLGREPQLKPVLVSGFSSRSQLWAGLAPRQRLHGSRRLARGNCHVSRYPP